MAARQDHGLLTLLYSQLRGEVWTIVAFLSSELSASFSIPWRRRSPVRYYLWNRETEEYLHNVVYGRDKQFWEYYLDEATNRVWWSRRALELPLRPPFFLLSLVCN